MRCVREIEFQTGNEGICRVSDIRPLAGRRCLVLDDEFLIALDIQQILEAAGASVVCVSKVDDALAALARGPRIDLAVLDVKLSDASGTSLTIAGDLAKRGTPVVFLTGMRQSDLDEMHFPDAPVVEKPYEAPLLVAAVVRALEGRPKQIVLPKMPPPADAGDDNVLS
ncbi:MAG: response regulator [Pseudolabrys sp.]|nr:response regulator [Pseudolabrys sp.]